MEYEEQEQEDEEAPSDADANPEEAEEAWDSGSWDCDPYEEHKRIEEAAEYELEQEAAQNDRDYEEIWAAEEAAREAAQYDMEYEEQEQDEESGAETDIDHEPEASETAEEGWLEIDEESATDSGKELVREAVEGRVGAGSNEADSVIDSTTSAVPAQSAASQTLGDVQGEVWVPGPKKTTWILGPESPAVAQDVSEEEGEEVPVELIVRDVEIDFAEPADEAPAKPAAASLEAAPAVSKEASARMSAAFQGRDDMWSPDLERERAASPAVSRAASARMISAFQDKDDQFDPDADLERLSDNFEQDEEAEAFFKTPKKPAPPPSKPINFFVEGDPTCG